MSIFLLEGVWGKLGYKTHHPYIDPNQLSFTLKGSTPMARRKAEVPAEETRTTYAERREALSIDFGIEIPPVVKESVYPWQELSEQDPERLASFFVPCESEDQANSRRSPIQTSGRNYFSKRGMSFTANSRVVCEDDVWGVRSWAPVVEEEEDSEE